MDIDTPSNFESPEFLNTHIQSTLEFYNPRVFSPEGGFFSGFTDAGTCLSPRSRQLVGSARYVFNYATAYRLYGDPKHRDWAVWGLDFLNSVHRQKNGGYAWLLESGKVADSRVMAYGHAFVLLAAASCVRAGISSAGETMNGLFDFMESYLF